MLDGHRPKTQRMALLLILALLFLLQLLTNVVAQAPVTTLDDKLIVDANHHGDDVDDSFAYNYYVGCYTARTDLLKESIYSKMPQTCIEICEHQTYSYAVLAAERCFCANILNNAERQDEQLCNTRCLANKSQYCGGVGVHSYYSTLLAKEPAPRHLQLSHATPNSLLVEWEAYEPKKMHVAGGAVEMTPTTQITNFIIRCSVVQTYSQLPFFAQPEFIVQSSEHRFEINDLQPATVYNVSVAAMCAQRLCGNASLLATTMVGQPSVAPDEPQVVESTSTTITVRIPPIRNDNGPVSQLLVIVERVDEALSQQFDTALLGDWQQAQQDGLPYYIAAELDYQRPDDAEKSRLFVVGDGKRYGNYINAPLNNKEAHLHISLAVVSTLNGLSQTLYARSTHAQHSTTLDNFTYANFDTGRESIIALTVTCVIFASCLALSLITYFYLRYKTCQVRQVANRLTTNTHELTLQQPIIERENNGFAVEDELPTAKSFKQQLNQLLDALKPAQRIQRSLLRMNANDVLAEGCYGEVISGTLLPAQQSTSTTPSTTDVATECALHMLSLDELTTESQLRLLKEFAGLSRLQSHAHLLHFYGVSASVDWLYFVFERQSVTLKRRLIESRRVPSAPMQRISALSEELALQWMYEAASAMAYLASNKVVHRQLCSHNVFVTAESTLKISFFGPTPLVNNQQKNDTTRWLAPETLRHQHYSGKSDVWAWACVAWECCTLGATPYPNIASSQELLAAIKSGARPAQPPFVYHDLYQLFLNCWQLEPSERTNFEDITLHVRQLMTSPKHALCFDRAPPQPQDSSTLDILPYYLPMLEMCN